MAGSVNWARKDSMEAAVVRVESPSRISRRMVLSPALESQKAVATPTMPPPMTTASAFVSVESGTKILRINHSSPLPGAEGPGPSGWMVDPWPG